MVDSALRRLKKFSYKRCSKKFSYKKCSTFKFNYTVLILQRHVFQRQETIPHTKATFTWDRICSDKFGIGSTFVGIHSVNTRGFPSGEDWGDPPS